jgi:PIN domain nuclease of toxin-antitoxin system
VPRLKCVVDTHTFLWAAVEDERLSAKAARVIATTPWDQLAIADVTLQEIGLLIHLGRLRLSAAPGTVLRADAKVVETLW